MDSCEMILYKLPGLGLLEIPKSCRKSPAEIRRYLEEKAIKLLDTLRSFKIDAKLIDITQGPSVTRFGLQLGVGIKVSKITDLSDDIALRLAVSGVRIEAPIPGKSAIDIEIPNLTSYDVSMREVMDTEEFKRSKSRTTVALGKDIRGECVIADIADFPHMLIVGATGSGKSVCINSLITSLLYKATPDEVKMIMVDTKMVELGVYNGMPHLLIPVIIDPNHAVGALNWTVVEMQNRYNLLKDNNVRSLDEYNRLMERNGKPYEKIPKIVIFIDELLDLIMLRETEIEESINRILVFGSCVGIHMVATTSCINYNTYVKSVKWNFQSRILLSTPTEEDERRRLGVDFKLFGNGDMLYMPGNSNPPLRIKGCFISHKEIDAVVNFIKSQYDLGDNVF